jgi:hypothetical protein
MKPRTSIQFKINLILYFHLRLGFPSVPLPSGFLTRILYASLSSPYMPHARNIVHDRITPVFSIPFYLIPLRPKNSPQHPILKHPQPRFLPRCERPSSTPINNKRQNHSSVYLNLYILFRFTQWCYVILNTNEVLQIQRFIVCHPMLHVSIQRIIVGHYMQKLNKKKCICNVHCRSVRHH